MPHGTQKTQGSTSDTGAWTTHSRERSPADFSCDQAALRTLLSVCPSVFPSAHPSVTPFYMPDESRPYHGMACVVRLSVRPSVRQMAKLYLYYYESSFMETIAKKFNNTSRFIDDLATLNNDECLQQFKERIYPKELVLNQENKDDNRATFLDLEAHIKDGKFYTKTYDKREAFNFEIVNYPDLSGNIPEWPAYGIYISQVIRYVKICNQTKDFIDRIRLLFNKLRKKHFSKERLLTALKKCCRKNPWRMDKHRHGMNNHLANDCWGADTWSWYRDSSLETSVSVHGWRHSTTTIKIHIPPPVLIQLVTRYLVNLLVRIKEPSSPTGWQQSPQLQAEETKKSRKLDCVATGFIYDDAVNFTVDVRPSVIQIHQTFYWWPSYPQ